jgi:hypothetical protein
MNEATKMPYIDSEGGLHIPFDSPEKYHYWNGGQSLRETLLELGAGEDIIRRYYREDGDRKIDAVKDTP